MESFLAIVEQTFYIKGRGLIVAQSFPVSEYKFDTQERVRVETPEGTELLCDAYFQIPFQNPRPKVLSFCCALVNVTKESVPIGSKLYIIGKSSIDIKSINTSY